MNHGKIFQTITLCGTMPKAMIFVFYFSKDPWKSYHILSNCESFSLELGCQTNTHRWTALLD